MDPEALLNHPQIVAVRYLAERLPDAMLEPGLFRAPKRAQRAYDGLQETLDQPLIDDKFATHTERRAFRDAIGREERATFELSLYRPGSRTAAGMHAQDLLESLKDNPYDEAYQEIAERFEEVTSTEAMEHAYDDLVTLVAGAVGVTPEPRHPR